MMKRLAFLFLAALLAVPARAQQTTYGPQPIEFSPANPYNWSQLQTFQAGIQNLGQLTHTTTRQPTGTNTIVCCAVDAENTIAFPSNSQDYRIRFWSDAITLSPGTTTGINESNFFQTIVTFNGTVTASNETNTVHSYLENDAGTGCSPITNCRFSGQQENFEASYLNNISAHQITGLLALGHNGANGTVDLAYALSASYSNDNVAAGSVTTYAVVNLEPWAGSSLPTNYYFARNNDANAAIATKGKLVIGQLGLGTTNSNVFIQAADSLSSTYNTVIKNGALTNILLFDNAGDLTIGGTFQSTGAGTITGGLKNTAIGVAGQTSTGTFTSLFASTTLQAVGRATFGSASLAAGQGGDIAMIKETDAAAAPGAGFGVLKWVAGTNAGSCKLIAYAGTSTTPTTVIDNVGNGC